MDYDILNIETISEFNSMLGVKTLHPLVSVINLSYAKPMHHLRHTCSFYVVFLKDEKNCELTYGRQRYDYEKGSVICLAPGQIIGIEDTGEEFQPQGWALCFHENLIKGTYLAHHLQEYSYFSYEVNEALHLSQEERDIFIDCLNKINKEIQLTEDRLSKRLIVTNIELLLDYCLRFYERQFTTRKEINQNVVSRFDSLLNDYFMDKQAQENGLPTVKFCAGKLCLSPNYFGDLIKKETGKSAQEYIQNKIISIAKELILNSNNSITQIAYELGFLYPAHFTRFFKKSVGVPPNDYKAQNG